MARAMRAPLENMKTYLKASTAIVYRNMLTT